MPPEKDSQERSSAMTSLEASGVWMRHTGLGAYHAVVHSRDVHELSGTRTLRSSVKGQTSQKKCAGDDDFFQTKLSVPFPRIVLVRRGDYCTEKSLTCERSVLILKSASSLRENTRSKASRRGTVRMEDASGPRVGCLVRRPAALQEYGLMR